MIRMWPAGVAGSGSATRLDRPWRIARPETLSDSAVKLTTIRDRRRSPVACWSAPATNGPMAMPAELDIWMNDRLTAISLGRMPGRWNGAE